MKINQFEVRVMPKTDSMLDDSCVLAMGDDEDALLVPTSYVTIVVAIADIVSPEILGQLKESLIL